MPKTTKQPQSQAKPDGNSRIRKQAERRLFVEFIALPYSLREKQFGFQYLQDFAKKYDVDATTLSKWQRSDDFWQSVRQCWRRWGRERTPNVIAALYESATTDKRAAEIRLWLEAVEEDLETRVSELEKLIQNKN